MAKRKPSNNEATRRTPAPRPAARVRKAGPAEVRLGEEHFRLLVESIKDYAILLLDPEGHVLSWNAGAERIKGYRPEEIIGRHFSVFYPPEAVAKGWPQEELRRTAAEGRFEDEGWRVKKDGSRFWANVILTALRDPSGRLVGFGKVTRDMTERKQAEEERAKLLNLREVVQQLASASAEILASTTQQASGAQEQAAAVSQTVATVDEVALTAEQSAQRARVVGEAAQRNLEIGRAGRQAIEDSITAKRRVQEQVESTAENILELAEKAQAIGEIIAAVNEIAEQTNLLALNAAIEAARAGEHGKGFAVVADEVRKLAERSQRETRAISDLIRDVQASTREAVEAMAQGTVKVNDGSAEADQAGRALDEILAAIQATVRQVEEIAAAVDEMAARSREVSETMTVITATAEETTAASEAMAGAADEVGRSISAITAGSAQNSAATEEVSASAEEMSAQTEEMSAQAQALAATAEQLKELVARFVLDDERHGAGAVSRQRPAERDAARPKPTLRRAG